MPEWIGSCGWGQATVGVSPKGQQGCSWQETVPQRGCIAFHVAGALILCGTGTAFAHDAHWEEVDNSAPLTLHLATQQCNGKSSGRSVVCCSLALIIPMEFSETCFWDGCASYGRSLSSGSQGVDPILIHPLGAFLRLLHIPLGHHFLVCLSHVPLSKIKFIFFPFCNLMKR